MRRPPRDDADDGAGAGPDGEVLAQKDLHVPAANGLHVEKTVFVDVLDHQGDLIAMAGQHDPWRPFAPRSLPARMQYRDDVAVPVGPDFIRILLGPCPNDILNGAFKTRS